MTTSQVLKRFRNYKFFSRDLLYYYIRRKSISFKRIRRDSGWIRDFPPEEVTKLEVLLKKQDLKRRIDKGGGEADLGRSDSEASLTSEPELDEEMFTDAADPIGRTPMSPLPSPADPMGLGPDGAFQLRSASRDRFDVKVATLMRANAQVPVALRELSKSLAVVLFDESDYRQTLRRLLSAVRTLFQAEASELFLANPHDPDEMILEERCCDKEAELSLDTVGSRIRLSNRQLADATTVLDHAQAELISRHSVNELVDSPLTKARPWDHLSRSLFSLLRIGVRDRKGHLIARLELQNKKGGNGVRSDTSFSESDARLSRILSAVVALVLEQLNVRVAVNRIANSLKHGEDLQRVLDDLLWTAQWLTGADRGDIALFNPARNELIIFVQRGESALVIGRAVPQKSVVFNLWSSEERRSDDLDLIADVRGRTYYFPANGFTQSEVAVRFDQGVLNLEAFRPRAFDCDDCDLLRDLAQCASVADSSSRFQSYPPVRRESNQKSARPRHITGRQSGSCSPTPRQPSGILVRPPFSAPGGRSG